MFGCGFLNYFEVLCSVTKGVCGMQDLYCLSISENKTRSSCDTNAQDGLPMASCFPSFIPCPYGLFPSFCWFCFAHTQELALQLKGIVRIRGSSSNCRQISAEICIRHFSTEVHLKTIFSYVLDSCDYKTNSLLNLQFSLPQIAPRNFRVHNAEENPAS